MVSKATDRELDTSDYAIKCAIGYDIFRDVEGGALTLTDRFLDSLEETLITTNLDLEDPNVGFEQLLIHVILSHVGEMEETDFKKVYRVVNNYFRKVYPELFLL